MLVIFKFVEVVKFDLLYLLLSNFQLDGFIDRLAFLFGVPDPVNTLFVVRAWHMAQIMRCIV